MQTIRPRSRTCRPRRMSEAPHRPSSTLEESSCACPTWPIASGFRARRDLENWDRTAFEPNHTRFWVLAGGGLTRRGGRSEEGARARSRTCEREILYLPERPAQAVIRARRRRGRRPGNHQPATL